MFKHYPLILMLAAMVCAAAPQFPAPQDLVTPSRWRSNSSGSMRITKDEAEQALRIDVTFSPTVDKWVYPYFDLRRYETINGATSLDFEICVIEPKEDYKGCREGNAFVNGFIKYPPPKSAIRGRIPCGVRKTALSPNGNSEDRSPERPNWIFWIYWKFWIYNNFQNIQFLQNIQNAHSFFTASHD